MILYTAGVGALAEVSAKWDQNKGHEVSTDPRSRDQVTGEENVARCYCPRRQK